MSTPPPAPRTLVAGPARQGGATAGPARADPARHHLILNAGADTRLEWAGAGQRMAVVLRRDSALLLPAGHSTALTIPAGVTCVEMPQSLFDSAAQSLDAPGIRMPPPRALPLNEVGRNLAQALSAALRWRSAGTATTIESLLAALAAWVLLQREDGSEAARPLPRRSGVERAAARIEAELDQALPLQSLADTAGMSRHHFGRCFKEAMGLSPHQYLLELRLQRALSLMQASLSARRNAPVGEVAMDAGFSTHSQFSAMFKRRFGVTPAQWLRDQRAGSVSPVSPAPSCGARS